jgi:hypothetical protein
MPVLMMDVRKMWVCVPHGLMRMRMNVRLVAIPSESVNMPMMLVMNVRMRVFQTFMRMAVLMALRHVQPDAPRHQSGGREQGERQRFVL